MNSREEYLEYIAKIKRIHDPKVHAITNSLGVRDAFNYYRKTKPEEKKYVLTDSQYYSIIRKTHQKLAQALTEGKRVTFPCGMGYLEIRRYKIEPKIDENGKFIYKAPANWGLSLKTWWEHEDARESKLVIKMERSAYFKIHYNKVKSRFKNQVYILFRPIRSLKAAVNKAALEGTLDAYEF